MNEDKLNQENEAAIASLSPSSAPLVRQILSKGHVPDILTCIANLSSDEVFTPPELVDKMLDIFPEEVWHDSSLKWLDPACKTGIFLRQIAKRLMEGLRDEFPDEEVRRQHIFKNMLYGIAITDLTALMSRRSLYTSKNASGDKSIAKFDNENGNISYDNRPHTYKNGTCIYCGNKEGGELDRDENQERHAYNFIHLTEKEIKNMKFDVIVGNPPYQLKDGGNGASAAPIYQYFVEQAQKLRPRYISFIIPSRWFAGGKGLDLFREEMLHNHHIKQLYDYPNAEDCFPGVEIAGGVCYFVIDSKYTGKCEITTILGEDSSTMERYLDEIDVFVRWNKGMPILRKVISRNESTISDIASSRKPFGLATNFKDFDAYNNPDKYKIYSSSQTGDRKISYVQKTRITKGFEYIDKWKVLMPKAFRLGSATDGGTVHPIIAEPGSVCTETFIILKTFSTEEEAKNFVEYIKTRFFRFLVLLHKLTQDATSKVYAFVPDLSMDRVWTDEKLYGRYEITDDERQFIESMVKEI
ncbi:Eco57I restriction-modification methylase domain-containing protein [Candidatus Saccharibacteria bacterium]|nr:Eco57I restriction-modification methylase domain-containing protein [Candidatus Saccharibacteria bacterium]